MTIEQLASPTAFAVLALIVLAFVRFGVWWAVLRVLLGPLLRPAGLILVALAVVAVTQLG